MVEGLYKNSKNMLQKKYTERLLTGFRYLSEFKLLQFPILYLSSKCCISYPISDIIEIIMESTRMYFYMVSIGIYWSKPVACRQPFICSIPGRVCDFI
jgi:hypothetical protein